MKNLWKVFMILFMVFFVFSCTVHHHHKPRPMPPGHAKKIMKSKSARPYAPGQVKKMNGKKHTKYSRKYKR